MATGPLKLLSVGAPLVGGLQEASAARAAGDAESAAALYNARLAERQGTLEASRRRRAGRQEVTRQRVASAAGDVALVGTPLDFIVDNAEAVERDAVNAEVDARRTAALERARARQAKATARTAAGTSLLTGLTQAGAAGYSLLRESR
jgi:hypothetical protein